MVASICTSINGIQLTLHPQTKIPFIQYMSQAGDGLISICGSHTKPHAVLTFVKGITCIVYFALLLLLNLDPYGKLKSIVEVQFHFNLVTDFQKSLRCTVFLHLDIHFRKSKTISENADLSVKWILFLRGRVALEILARLLPRILAGLSHRPSLPLSVLWTNNWLLSWCCLAAPALVSSRLVRSMRLSLT